MQEYKYYKTDDFIHDEYFQEWVIGNNDKALKDWEDYYKKHPDQVKDIEEARVFLQSLIVTEPEVEPARLENTYRILKEKYFSNARPLSMHMILRYVAGVVVVIGLAGLYFMLYHTPKHEFAQVQDNRAKLILSDGTVKLLEDESFVQFQSENFLVVGDDTLMVDAKNHTSDYQQLIIPYGKRSRIQLSDGSIVYLNSGSKLKYPVSFSSDIREVFAEGEFFFEVVENKSKPFVVRLKNMDVTVTGTRFNVSAYPEENNASAVLLSGKVSVSKKGHLFKRESIDLNPGEGVFLDDQTNLFVKKEVEAENYYTWINGYYILTNVPLKDVIKKLVRYYNIPVNYSEDIEGITFSGKLDFTSQLHTVLENLAFTTSSKVTENEDGYFLKFDKKQEP